MSRYDFLRSPLWVAGVVISLVAIVVFVNLGLWQLRRLDERREINAVITEGDDEPAMQLGAAIATYGIDPEALAFRRVSVIGEFESSDEVLLVGTTLNGRSGHDVVTPLRTDGVTIAVNRGWVPIDISGPPVVGAEPLTGTVEIDGWLMKSQTFGSLGTPESDGSYDQVGRIDLDVLSGQWGGDVLPVYLQLHGYRSFPAQEAVQDQQVGPPAGNLPYPRPPLEPSEGPHLSYALQWFIFAAIVAIGFPVLIYRTGR